MRHELTISLKPILYKMTIKEQFDFCRPFIVNILRGEKHTTIAELTKVHNLHFHSVVELNEIGTMEHKDKIINRLRGYNKYFGKHTFDPVRYEVSYDNYMMEDYHITSRLINDPIVKDDFGLCKLIQPLFESQSGKRRDTAVVSPFIPRNEESPLKKTRATVAAAEAQVASGSEENKQLSVKELIKKYNYNTNYYF